MSSLTLSIAASSIVENAGPAATTGTVTRVGTDNTVPMTVNLSSSDTSKAAVPASVVIPANQSSATFNIDAVDQDLVAGSETVTISATAQTPSAVSLDPNFGGAGIVSQVGNTAALALQSDGKIVTIYGGSALYVSRYNTDGSIDTSFGGTGTVSVDASGASSDQAEAVAIQADGKIVVGGIGGPGPHFNFILVRFNSDGTLDSTFGNGGSELSVLSNGYYNEMWDLGIQSDGHILAVGNVDYTQSGGGFDLAVVRYNSNGSLDTTFGNNGVAGVVPNHGGRAFGMAQQSNSDIVIAGEDGGGNYYSEFAVARFTPTGQLDTTFGNGGKVLTDVPGDYEQGQDVTIQPDGKLVVVGQVGQTGVFPPKYDIAVARYNADGSLDASFGSGGIIVTSEGGSYSRMGVALQGTGQIIVSGNNGTKSGLLRYNPDGTLDTSNFTSSSGTAAVDTLVQPDGLILLIGANGPYNGFLERYVGSTTLPASATLTVQSDESNSAPVAVNDSYSMYENLTLSVAAPGVLANDTDPDADTLTAALVSGPSNGSLTLNSDGSFTYTPTANFSGTDSFTYTASDRTNTSSPATVTITVNPTDTLVLAGFPSPIASGSTGTFTLTAYAPSGSVDTAYSNTVHFTSSDSAAVLPADYTFTASDAGVHTFSATMETAGTQSLTATDMLTNVTGSQTGILVKPNNFYIAVFSDTTTAGVPLTLYVTAQNANGSVATGYTGTVHFTSTDNQAVLPADYTFTSGDAGFHAFSATFKTAGTQTVTVTDTALSIVTGSINHIHVSAAALSMLGVTGFPSPTTAGVSQNFAVTAEDAYGNTISTYRGTVTFSSSDTKAGLPGPYTFSATDNGVHTFSATLKTAGIQALTATDRSNTSITGTQSGITVNPASASIFSVTGFPSPIVAGTAGSFTVTAKDAYGNVATGYQGTVKFTSSDQRALLPANYTFVAADAGVHTFTNGATLKTAGTQSISASDTVTSSIRGTQGGIVVNAASTSMFRVSGFPSPVTAGTAGSVTVTAQDAYGNKTTSYTGTVHFTSTDAQAVLPADYTFTSTDAGVHTFTNGVTLKTAGNQSITATDTVTSSITGKQTAVVNPAAAASLQVTGYPSPTTAGVSHTFSVRAKDAYGNVATGYTGTVTFTSSDSKAVLPANYTFVSGDHGVHTFSATFKTAGTQSLTATDTVTSSITGTQSGIVVNAAAASILVVSGYRSPITHGTSGTFTVTAEDAYGNVATNYHGTVKFSSSDTAASLPANYTFTASDAGVHTFTTTLILSARSRLPRPTPSRPRLRARSRAFKSPPFPLRDCSRPDPSIPRMSAACLIGGK